MEGSWVSPPLVLMPASKFTVANQKKVIEALSVGASRRTAAAIAQLDHKTVLNWIHRGQEAKEGTYRQFFEKVIEAEAHPRMRALGVIYSEMENRPDLAWKFIERREPGYSPPMPQAPSTPIGPVVVQLAFSGRKPLELEAENVIEGEVVD